MNSQMIVRTCRKLTLGHQCYLVKRAAWIRNLSLSFDHTIETMIRIDKREDQNYCYEIAKL